MLLRRSVLACALIVTFFVTAVPATDVAAAPEPSFTPILPVRLLDTRPDFETVDGEQAEIGRRFGGEVFELQITGRGGIPDDADAAMFNVIAEQPGAAGYITVFPCGPTPNASHVNYLTGQVVSNAAVSGLTDDGTVCLFTLSATDLVVDVTGYSLNGGVVPFTPERLYETRFEPQFRTIDHDDEHTGRLGARATYELQIAGRGSVPDDARAAFLNVTAIQPSAPGYLTVFPCDEGLPDASHVNYLPGQFAPNAVMAKLDADGKVCLFTIAETDIIVDVGGYSDEGVEPLTPTRLLDTRIGAKTSDGLHAGRGRVGAGETYRLDLVGRGGITDMSAAAIINVTAVDASDNGFLTVYPCDRDRPNSSNVNFFTGQTVPNAVLARIDTAGTICIYTLAATHLIVDVGGYSLLKAPEYRRNVLAADSGFTCGIRSAGNIDCWGTQAPADVPEGEYDAVSIRHSAFGSEQVCGVEKISMRLSCIRGDNSGPMFDVSITEVVLDSDISCVLSVDGEPVCWGPRVKADPPAGVTFTTIDVGGGTHFACGVTTDRSIACWGADVGPTPAGEYLDVSVSLQYACGLRTSGQLTCWHRHGTPFETPHGSFSSIEAERWEACGIRDDGTLHCWIFTDSSKLKDFPDVRFKYFVSGGYYGCGIDVDDKVHCWGRGFFGGGTGAPTDPW